MFKRLLLTLAVVLALVVLPAGAQAQSMLPSGLPPGIQAQAEPLMMQMMQHMQSMQMSPQQMQMMMADMQMMADQLPPGVFLELLRLMTQMSSQEMMRFHTTIHSPGMAGLSPGQMVAIAEQLVRP